MSNLVSFNNNSISVIDYKHEKWLTSFDIAKALDYEKTKSITNLYNKHKDEFEENISLVIDSMTSGKKVKTRIFNREGAWLIGMFARTPKAAEFRKWVLKVLGSVADSSKVGTEVAVREHTRSLPAGKKEIVLSEKAKTEIGGIVKAVVQAELSKVFAPAGQDGEHNPSGMPFGNWAVSAVHAVGAMQSEYRALRKKQEDALKLLSIK